MQAGQINLPIDQNVPGGTIPKTKVKDLALPKQEKAPPKPAVSEELSRLSQALAKHEITLRFSTDDRTNDVVVQLIDEKTGEAVTQFPTEVSLNLAANYIKLQGQFVDETK